MRKYLGSILVVCFMLLLTEQLKSADYSSLIGKWERQLSAGASFTLEFNSNKTFILKSYTLGIRNTISGTVIIKNDTYICSGDTASFTFKISYVDNARLVIQGLNGTVETWYRSTTTGTTNQEPQSSQSENRNIDVNNEFLQAVNDNDIEGVKKALNSGANVNATGEDNWIPLVYAYANGYIELVKILLIKGANVNVKNNSGYTALIAASDAGHIEIVKTLLLKGADVNMKDKNNNTALMSASFKGHIEIVKMLLLRNAELNVRFKNSYTALMLACSKGYIEIVKLLLLKGADVNLKYGDSY